MLRSWLAALAPVFVLAACAGTEDRRERDPARLGAVAEPLTAECTAAVQGSGVLDVETVYLPDVVHCENGGAPLESLKAQAIAARTYLYYKLETSGSIADGQGDQVYSCGSHADALEKQAVSETAGMVLRYSMATIAAFYVAGGTSSPPACHDTSSSTSGDVTYNAGKSGSAITQTRLGLVDPSNTRNRGCMSQLGSRCLANTGMKADAILKFYYGDDIAITQATGPCIPTPDAGTSSDGGTDGASPDASLPLDGGGPGDEATSTAPLVASDQGCSLASAPRAPGPAHGPRARLEALAALVVLVAMRSRRRRSGAPR